MADDFDPINCAEQAARDWSDHYVGKRRALDREVVRDLVAARVAFYLDDRIGHDRATASALGRMLAQGHTWDSAHATIRRVSDDIDVEAHVQLDLLRLDQWRTPADMAPGLCLDPALHRQWDVRAGQTEASRMKIARGCCPWCSLPVVRP